MITMKRIERYLTDADAHRMALTEAMDELATLPLTTDGLRSATKLQRVAMEVLLFRFAKLQDLMGSKLFRAYLEAMGFVTEEKSFFELLKELENEGILNVDVWAYLREVRNTIAHEYPEEEEKRVEELGLLLEAVPRLFEILDKMRERIDAVAK